MLNQDSEIVICSRFVNCDRWSCDKNSTLGSVVPLAMFIYFIFQTWYLWRKFSAQELFCQNMPALNWKVFQLLCRWRRWCICWRPWTWWSSCWRCWTCWTWCCTCWRWSEDHVEDCASLTGCGRESFLQVVQLLRSHQIIFEGSFPNSNLIDS